MRAGGGGETKAAFHLLEGDYWKKRECIIRQLTLETLQTNSPLQCVICLMARDTFYIEKSIQYLLGFNIFHCFLFFWLTPSYLLAIHSPELYRSCSWLLKKGILLPFSPNPWLCNYQSWWSLYLPFSTMFICNLLCFQLHLISMSDLLLDNFHWKCWGQQRWSTWSMTENKLSQESTAVNFMGFHYWKFRSFL